MSQNPWRLPATTNKTYTPTFVCGAWPLVRSTWSRGLCSRVRRSSRRGSSTVFVKGRYLGNQVVWDEGGGGDALEKGSAVVMEVETAEADTEVRVDNAVEDRWTVIRVRGKDQPGLFGELCGELVGEGMEIVRFLGEREMESGRVSVEVSVRKSGAKIGEGEVAGLRRRLAEVCRRGPRRVERYELKKEHIREQVSKLHDNLLVSNSGIVFNVSNGVSKDFTVMFLSCPERKGLVLDVFETVLKLQFDIKLASLTTYEDQGELRHDTFYVTDMEGNQLSELLRNNLYYFMHQRLVGAKP